MQWQELEKRNATCQVAGSRSPSARAPRSCDEVGGQPLGNKGIQPPPPEPDGHVSVHPALQTQDLLGVTVRPGKPGPPAGGRRILLGGAYGGPPGRRALASGSAVASARRTRRRVCLPPCGCGGR